MQIEETTFECTIYSHASESIFFFIYRMTFQRGEKVEYVSGRGNIYKCTVLHCFGPDAYRGVLGGPNACVLKVDESKIISDQEYIYPIGSEMVIHKSRLTRQLVDVIQSKAKSLAVTNVYEGMTGQSGEPGRGPANTIRAYAGINVPKGVGGKRNSKKARKAKEARTRRNKKSKAHISK
jgi:hypothetical protein